MLHVPRTAAGKVPLLEHLQGYKAPSLAKSLPQLVSTLLLLVFLWYAAFSALERAYWLSLLLAIPAGGILVRVFIIQHDCGHGSFFGSRRANDLLGFVLGVVTLTPYTYWRRTHAIHHVSFGKLASRDEFGYLGLLTVREYQALSPVRKVCYRIYRNPWFLLTVGVPFQYLIKHRFPWDVPRSWSGEWASVLFTNVTLVGVAGLAWATIGFGAFLLVHGPIVYVMAVVGGWFFYIQHNFETVRWAHEGDWSFERAGLEGSSYYDLPGVLHWLTGHVGLHHVHHLCPQIPNYRLAEALAAIPRLQQVPRLTLRKSLSAARLKVWDEDQERMVGFLEEERAGQAVVGRGRGSDRDAERSRLACALRPGGAGGVNSGAGALEGRGLARDRVGPGAEQGVRARRRSPPVAPVPQAFGSPRSGPLRKD